MSKKLIFLFIIYKIFCYNKDDVKDTDCLPDTGTTDQECKEKTTFIDMDEYGFAVEEEKLYLCCHYKGKIKGQNFDGCFPFIDGDVDINNENGKMENKIKKGKWSFGKVNNPVVECKMTYLSITNYFLLIFFILFV